MMPGHIVQGCSAEMGADVEQTTDHGQDAGEHADVGTWIALKDAAALLGISVDTVKRRMHRGELESRRETIPQGFRWLVRVDPPETEAGESSLSDRSDNRGVDVPLPSTDVVAVMQAQLEARNREVASLLATIASQARALEQAEERLRQLTATAESTGEAVGSPESDHDDDQDAGDGAEPRVSPRGVWARLRRWWSG
jgi:hypothetical protein